MLQSTVTVRADDGDNDEAAEGQLTELRDQYRELMNRVESMQNDLDALKEEAAAVKQDAASIWSESGLDEQEDGELNPENWD